MKLVAVVRLPQLGESVTEGTVEGWLKQVGDMVRRDEPLVEVVTDKVSAEIPSPFEGKLLRIAVDAGLTVAVGTVLAEMEVAADAADQRAQPGASADSTAPKVPDPEPAAGEQISPAVRRLVEENGLDLSALKGTGAGGRVTRADVLKAIDARGGAPVGPNEELVPLTPVRRQIAQHLTKAAAIPHAWAMREVDMSGLVLYRREHKDEFQERYGVPLSLIAFVTQVVCEALRANPLLNSIWREDGILVKRYINLGIAVALPDAVIVPVIKGADTLGFVDLARAVHDLTTRARDGKLRPDDVQGGTFTLNNTGAIGGDMGMSIINHPQAAILNTESIVRRPVVRDEEIVIRDVMNLTLSFDHRVVDGLQAGQFLSMVQAKLQDWTPASIRF